MESRLPSIVLSAATGLALLWHTGETGGQPSFAIGPDAEVTSDGLHKIDPSIMGTAWVRPDADLSRYTHIFSVPTAIQFREVPERWYTIRTMATADAFHINDGRKERLRELFRDKFNEVLPAVQSFDPSDEVGRDVLMVQGILTDVTSGVPPDLPGSLVTNIRWAWEATMVLELRDSMSDVVLARTAERQRIDGPMDATVVGALTPTIVDGWTRKIKGD